MRPKQAAFVESYLQNFNATQAALAAGYSPKTAYSIGAENLKKPEIAAAIRERLDALKMTADEVLTGLASHARGTMEDFVRIDDKGEPWIDFRQAVAKNQMHLVKRFKVKKKSGDGWTETEVEVELYDAQRAKELIGRHHGLFPNRVDVDWKREMQDAGLNPDEAVETLADEFIRHLTGSAAATPPGSLGTR